ncbi:MAG: hypothetical protein ACXWUG_05985 [Polyangiales bacterium]
MIGSGAHCEIRVPAEHAAVEHVEVTMTPGGAYAQARALDHLPTINGSEFMQTPVLEGSVLGIGAVQIQISVVQIEDNPNVIKKKAEKTSPMTYILALVVAPVALYIIMSDDDQQVGKKIPTDVPALWAEPIAACPVAAPDQAGALAAEKWVLAEGKAERRPFRVQDGVLAVPLYETAAACFKTAGDTEHTSEAAKAGATLRAKVAEDYRAHQVRLEHALSVNDLHTAFKEVKVLRAFTEGQGGQYVVWLGNLDRQLTLKLGEKKS